MTRNDEVPQEVSEALARAFHEAYERLAPSFGYATRADTREFDPASPNGRLMIAVCNEVTTTLRAKLEAAEGEVARLREDARRLDWLADKDNPIGRQAIDDAMALQERTS